MASTAASTPSRGTAIRTGPGTSATGAGAALRVTTAGPGGAGVPGLVRLSAWTTGTPAAAGGRVSSQPAGTPTARVRPSATPATAGRTVVVSSVPGRSDPPGAQPAGGQRRPGQAEHRHADERERQVVAGQPGRSGGHAGRAG